METINQAAQDLIDETTIQKGEKKKLQGRVTFSSNPIKTFGVLFNHIFPIDISIVKYCFQGCPWCFATANKRATGDVIGKNVDPSDIVFKKIQKANGQGYDPLSLQEWCIRRKYPMVFSNNVDPFLPASEAQFKLGERMLRMALDYKQKLFIQTKEVYYGKAVKDLLIEGKDLFQLYVSLSTLDYDTAKKYETVAVTPQQRLERIREMADAGLRVTVALNPYVPEWQPDLRKYFEAVKAAGAYGVYAYPLHLTAPQKKVMPKRMGQFINMANRYNDFYEDTKLMEKICSEINLKLHYPRRMPDDFYNGNGLWADEGVWPIDPQRFMESVHEIWAEEKNMPVVIEWKDIDAHFKQFEEWEHVFKLNDFAGVLWTDNENYFQVRSALGDKNKMKNIVRFIWNNPETQDMFLSFYNTCFVLVDGAGNNENEVDYVLDDNGDLIYAYDPTYTKDGWYMDQNDPSIPGFIEME